MSERYKYIACVPSVPSFLHCWFWPNFTMATSDEIELEVEELMVSSSLDALCHVAQELDLD